MTFIRQGLEALSIEGQIRELQLLHYSLNKGVAAGSDGDGDNAGIEGDVVVGSGGGVRGDCSRVWSETAAGTEDGTCVDIVCEAAADGCKCPGSPPC